MTPGPLDPLELLDPAILGVRLCCRLGGRAHSLVLTVLDGVLQGEDTTLGLGLVTHVGVLLTHTHHHTLEETEHRDIVSKTTQQCGVIYRAS